MAKAAYALVKLERMAEVEYMTYPQARIVKRYIELIKRLKLTKEDEKNLGRLEVGLFYRFPRLG